MDSTLGTKQGSHDMKGDSAEMKPIEEEYDEMDGHTEQTTINRYVGVITGSINEHDVKIQQFYCRSSNVSMCMSCLIIIRVRSPTKRYQSSWL